MVHHHLKINGTRSICDAPGCSHNRWHPNIEPALRIKNNETVEIQGRDAADGQIRPGMTPGDLDGFSFDRCHPLTGPIFIEGAAPGDLLAIHVENVQPSDHGFTAVLPGLGILSGELNGPFLLHWDCENGYATSRQLPGVRIQGNPFMGIMGVAPSLDRLRHVNRQESAAAQNNAHIFGPLANGAVPSAPDIVAEGWRTIAPQDTGGNVDIRQLTAGSTLYVPVDVPGALFSTGDGHFAQGDGESCGTAIEMAATLTARFEILKGAATAFGQTSPSFVTNSVQAQSETHGFLGTTGRSIRTNGQISPFDATLAAQNAVRAMIRQLAREYDLSPEQAYCVISVAGDLRLSAIVNTPYALVSLTVPKSIFHT